jgi:hypothetical protein
MSVGAAEWEIVSRLGTPRSAAEICRSVEGNDFRTCQVLWTLRVVGAIGNLPTVTQAAEDNDAAASATGFDLVESIVPENAEADVPDDLSSPSFDSEPTPADAEPQAVTGSETATTDEAAAPLPPEDERSCGTPADETAAAVEEPIDLPFGAPEAPVPEPQEASSSEDDASESAAIEIADSTEAEPLQEAFAAAEETADADRSPEDVEQERALLADLDEAVSRFNARHRLVYRAIRAEIGAAAANFVRACHNRLGEDVARIFADSRLLPDGTWDTESLKKAAIARRQLDAHAEFEKMIASELDLLRIQIGDTKYEMLRDQIEQA